MLRVLLVSRHHGAEIRGATVATHGLACALRDRGHQVTLVHSARPEHRLDVEGIQMRYYRSRRKSLYPLLYGAQPLRGYDVIHSNDESGAYLALRSRWSRLPLAAHIHASVAKTRSFWKAGWRWRYIELTVRNAPVLITPSGWAADQLAARFGRAREDFRVIPNGLGEHWFSAARASAIGAAVPLRVVLVNMQGVDVALRAFAKLPPQVQARLELYGRDKHQDQHRKLAGELGIEANVIFAGFVPNDELVHRMSGADLLIHPSRRESFGQVLGEAAALGLPVLASRVDAIPEVVLDQETGLLCPMDDVEAFAAGLRRLLSDAALRSRLGEAAGRRARRLWRWDAVSAQLENEVYAPLLERRAG